MREDNKIIARHNYNNTVLKHSFKDFDYMLFVLILNMRFLYDLSTRLMTFVGVASEGIFQVFRIIVYLLLFFILIYRLIFIHNRVIVPLKMMILLSIVILSSQLVNSNLNQMLQIQVILTFSHSISFFLVTYYASSDPKSLYISMKKLLPAVIIYSFLIISNPILNKAGSVSGYQALSYYLLPFSLMCFWEGIKNKKLLYLIIGIFFLYIIIGYGGRGALISMLISISFLLYLNKKSYKMLIVLALISLIFFLVYNFWDQILIILENYLPYSRTVTMLRLNKFTTYESRTNIIAHLLDVIKESPFRITGFGANHLYVNEYYNRIGLNSPLTATHSHNILVALLVDWGVVLGGFLCVSLIAKFYRALKDTIKAKDDYVKIVFTIIILTNFIHSMVSGSYATGGEIWISLGYIVAKSKKSRIRVRG